METEARGCGEQEGSEQIGRQTRGLPAAQAETGASKKWAPKPLSCGPVCRCKNLILFGGALWIWWACEGEAKNCAPSRAISFSIHSFGPSTAKVWLGELPFGYPKRPAFKGAQQELVHCSNVGQQFDGTSLQVASLPSTHSGRPNKQRALLWAHFRASRSSLGRAGRPAGRSASVEVLRLGRWGVCMCVHARTTVILSGSGELQHQHQAETSGRKSAKIHAGAP